MMDSNLTPDQLRELRIELDGQRAELLRSMKLTDVAAETVELDQTSVGRLSRMDSLQNQGLTKNLQERERVRLAEIDEALRRLDNGRFGACTRCGDAIPFGRLSVFPEVATCGGCGAV